MFVIPMFEYAQGAPSYGLVHYISPKGTILTFEEEAENEEWQPVTAIDIQPIEQDADFPVTKATLVVLPTEEALSSWVDSPDGLRSTYLDVAQANTHLLPKE